MAFGFGVLRLSSDAFWSLTPRELAAASDGARGRARIDQPTSRATLARLMAAFPDGDGE
jgi:uncharacterized phage protein (TIGR02216 family)